MTLTLGSLFDGIGGFPLAAIRQGITPLWASEIEPFPIQVTKHHFPETLHMGDITRLDGAKLPPVYVYAVETAIQMTLTELNENLREIYIEAYTEKEASEYILRETAKELHGIFGSYLPDATERDFYDMEIGSASIMRGYMAHPCDGELTLEKKLRLFLTMSLRAYNVPKEEVEQVIRFVEGLDIRGIAEQVMQKLFKALAMRYEFSLSDLTQPGLE